MLRSSAPLPEQTTVVSENQTPISGSPTVFGCAHVYDHGKGPLVIGRGARSTDPRPRSSSWSAIAVT